MWVIIAVGVVVVALTHWLLSPYNYWKSVPCPKPTILLGNLSSSITLKKNLGQIYKDIYDEYKDALYVGYYKFRQPGIILRDMDLIRDILVKEFSSFHDNDIQVDEKVDPTFSRNPFVLTGERWKLTRGQITGSITHLKVKNMFSLINAVGDIMVDYLNKLPDATSADGVDAKELSAKFTTDAVASCAFGLDGKSFTDPKSVFREMGRKFLNTSFWTNIQILIVLILPELAKRFRIKLVPTEVEEWFSQTVKETVRYRETNKIVRNDYMDLLISLKSKPTKYGFTDIDVVAQALTFFSDGFETSSIALSYALYEIARHPEVQARLKEEIDEVVAKHDNELTYDAVLDMPYLDKVFCEALRLHVPVLSISRLCTKEYVLPPPKGEGSGPSILIKPGTPVIIPSLAIHHDPAIYPEPQKFDPERFTEENKNSRPKCSYLAFGEGPRICLGSRFAIAQTKAALVRIVSNFEIKVNKKTIEPLQIDPKYFLMSSVGGIWLNFYKRV